MGNGAERTEKHVADNREYAKRHHGVHTKCCRHRARTPQPGDIYPRHSFPRFAAPVKPTLQRRGCAALECPDRTHAPQQALSLYSITLSARPRQLILGCGIGIDHLNRSVVLRRDDHLGRHLPELVDAVALDVLKLHELDARLGPFAVGTELDVADPGLESGLADI